MGICDFIIPKNIVFFPPITILWLEIHVELLIPVYINLYKVQLLKKSYYNNEISKSISSISIFLRHTKAKSLLKPCLYNFYDIGDSKMD